MASRLCSSSQPPVLSSPPTSVPALSKGQGSFCIQPMKATHNQKDLLHHVVNNLPLSLSLSIICICPCSYICVQVLAFEYKMSPIGSLIQI